MGWSSSCFSHLIQHLLFCSFPTISVLTAENLSFQAVLFTSLSSWLLISSLPESICFSLLGVLISFLLIPVLTYSYLFLTSGSAATRHAPPSSFMLLCLQEGCDLKQSCRVSYRSALQIMFTQLHQCPQVLFCQAAFHSLFPTPLALHGGFVTHHLALLNFLWLALAHWFSLSRSVEHPYTQAD